jgi:RHS repeat-associated protein
MKNRIRIMFSVGFIFSIFNLSKAQVEGPTQVCPGTGYQYQINPDWLNDNAISSGWVAIGGTVNASSLTQSTITWNANATQRRAGVTTTYVNITYDEFGFPNYDYFTVDYYLNIAITPAAPVVTPPGSLCRPSNITLTASGANAGESYRWYTETQTLIPGQTGSQCTTFISTNTSVYVSIVNSLGCDESPRKKINVYIDQMASPFTNAFFRCGPGNVSLTVDPNIDLNGVPNDRVVSYLRWYSQPSGGSYLYQVGISPSNPYATYTTYFSGSTTYYAANLNPFNGCESDRSPLTITIQTLPSISFQQSSFEICSGETINPSFTSDVGVNQLTVNSTYDPWISGILQNSNSSLSHVLTNNGNVDGNVTYTIVPYLGGCMGNGQTILIKVKPRPQFSSAIPDRTVCSGTNVSINPSSNVSSSSFRWTYNILQGSVSGANAFTATSFNQTLTNTVSTQARVNYIMTATKNGCDGATTSFKIFVDAPSNGGTLSGSQAVFTGNNNGTVVSGGSLGSIARWRQVQNGIATDIANTNTSLGFNNLSQTTTYKAVVKNGVCAETESQPAVVTVEDLPTVSGSTNIIMGQPILLSVVGSYSTYQWKNESGSVVSNASTYTTNVPEKYNVTVTKAGVTGSGTSSFFTLRDHLEGQNLNYISVSSVQLPNIKSVDRVRELSVDVRSLTIQYFDGLGRPMQTVGTQASPTKKDMVQTMAYDAFGREARKYLPMTIDQSTSVPNGWYKPNLIELVTGNPANELLSFYASPPAKVQADPRPYTETIFEPSPLNRPSKDFGVGQDWYANNKHVKHDYLVNVHGTAAGQEKVIAWTVNASNLPVRASAVAGYVETGGYYATGQLSIKSTKDEQGNEVREYTDKEGRVILKKVQAVVTPTLSNRLHWAQTYFIYDDLGNKRFVLQPELSKTVHQNDTYNPSATDLANFAFQYTYDARRRTATAQVPGAQAVYMVYDNRDRLILTQDGNQRTGTASTIKYWSFTKYDELNRPIMTGIKDTTVAGATVLLTQAQMQAAVDAHFAKASARWGETYVGNVAGNVHGYTNRAYPVRTGAATEVNPNKYLTVTYYDNYSFRSGWTGSYTYVNENLSEATNGITYTQPATESNMTLGLPTGGKTKVLDGGVTGGFTWLKAITYYDDKGRAVQSIADNYKGGVDRNTSVVDFVGKVLRAKTTHSESDVTWKEMVGVSVVGNKLTRTATTTAGAASTQVLGAGQNGWLEVTVSETSTNKYIGLNDANPDVNATNIDYAFYLNGTTLRVVENNTTRLTQTGVLVPGDVVRIERNGSVIRYFRNGIQLSYQNNAAISSALMVDVSLQSNSATLVGVRTSFGSSGRTVVKRMVFDHGNRPLRTYHQVDNNAEVLLAQNEYNEIGQLVDKKLHSTDNGSTFKQSVDYRYNIRGWLSNMNNSSLVNDGVTNDDTNDLFGMNLLYNTVTSGINNVPDYTGNISAIVWSNNLTLGNIKERAYLYFYDQLDRLSAATHKEKTSLWNSSTSFHEDNLTYDQQGNIITLNRKGANGASLDNLAYNYGSGTTLSNRLLKVTDAGDKTKGFVDGANTGNDYTYDNNGNLLTDQNKGIISSIVYNFLDLPSQVTKNTNERVFYTYDAMRKKLAQNIYTSAGVLQKTTDYVGDFYYENDTLKFINHEEGRTVMVGASPEYQYHLKDHLGNVRTTFTSKDEIEANTATLEPANATAEQGKFLRYASAKLVNSSLFDRTNGSSPTQTLGYAQRLNGSANEKYGLARSISVMPGDVVSAEVYAKYVDPNSSNWNSALATLMNQIATSTAGVVIDGANYSTSTSTFPYAGLNGTTGSSGTGPKAYLNWLVFDRNFVFKNGGYTRMTTAAREYGQDVAHELLASPTINITEPGYVYIYLSNEETAPLDVYFDQMKVTQTKSPVVEDQFYYAFGLMAQSYSKESSMPNMYKYNGKEMQDELNLGWLDYGARMYMADIGRWGAVDPLAEKMTRYSPYNYAFDNPVRFDDPDGMGPGDRVKFAMAYINKNIPYGQEYYPNDKLRYEYTTQALEFMDCAEFVSRVLFEDGLIDDLRTVQGVNETPVRKMMTMFESEDSNWEIVSGDPKQGDVVAWDDYIDSETKKSKQGHIALIGEYDSETKKVTLLHSTAYKNAGAIKDPTSFSYFSSKGKTAKFYRRKAGTDTPDGKERKTGTQGNVAIAQKTRNPVGRSSMATTPAAQLMEQLDREAEHLAAIRSQLQQIGKELQSLRNK